MSQFRKISIFLLLSLYGYNVGYSQKFDRDLLKVMIEKNSKILGLDDSTLVRASNQIRIFNLSKIQMDSSLMSSINPENGQYSFMFNNKYNVDIISNDKIVTDINTGKYRDIFIVRSELQHDTFRIATIAFTFKPVDGLMQNKILAEFEFVNNKNGYHLTAFKYGLVN